MAVTDPTLPSPPTPAGDAAKFVARQFRPEHLAQVHKMFVEGMSDYPAHREIPEFAQFIQQNLEGDLGDIEGVYMAPGGNFWVVTPADEPSRAVGMVALESKGNGEGELRRMSVARGYRRSGIGRLLLSSLEQWASANGYRKVWLTTGAVMDKARAFYEATGFVEIGLIAVEGGYYAVKFEKALSAVAPA